MLTRYTTFLHGRPQHLLNEWTVKGVFKQLPPKTNPLSQQIVPEDKKRHDATDATGLVAPHIVITNKQTQEHSLLWGILSFNNKYPWQFPSCLNSKHPNHNDRHNNSHKIAQKVQQVTGGSKNLSFHISFRQNSSDVSHRFHWANTFEVSNLVDVRALTRSIIWHTSSRISVTFNTQDNSRFGHRP